MNFVIEMDRLMDIYMNVYVGEKHVNFLQSCPCVSSSCIEGEVMIEVLFLSKKLPFSI